MGFLTTILDNLAGQLRDWNASQLRSLKQWRHVAAVAIIGVSVAFLGVGLEASVRWMEHHILGDLAGYTAPGPARMRSPDEFAEYEHNLAQWRAAGSPKQDPASDGMNRWLLFLLPGLSGALVAAITFGFAPRFQGDGTEVTVHALHHHGGNVPISVAMRKLVASVFTATFGSSGTEGPIAQAGGGVGNYVGLRLGLDARRRRKLVIAGMAAGVGALFRVPLGGALYACEVLYRENEFESEALMPAFIGSIVAYSIFCPVVGEGWGALLLMPQIQYTVPLQLIFYGALSVLLAGCGIVFVKGLEFCRNVVFTKRLFPLWLRPMLGGLCVGVLAMNFPFILGSGYGYLQGALLNQYTFGFCLLFAVLKLVATCLTIGSGNAGGLFAPSIVIGGAFGAVAGIVGYEVGIIEDPAQVVIVGMAGFFGGVAKTPISTLIMVSEMTLGYGLLVPLMAVTTLTYMLIPRNVTITATQVLTRRDSPAHRGDYIVDVLSNLRVRDIPHAYDVPPMVQPETTLQELNQLFTLTEHEAIPVIDEQGEMEGMLLMSDLKEHLLLLDLGTLVLAADLARHDIEPICLDDDISTAMGRLLAAGVDELPVVEESGKMRVVGGLSRREIIDVYQQQMSLLSSAESGEPDEPEAELGY